MFRWCYDNICELTIGDALQYCLEWRYVDDNNIEFGKIIVNQIFIYLLNCTLYCAECIMFWSIVMFYITADYGNSMMFAINGDYCNDNNWYDIDWNDWKHSVIFLSLFL